MRILCRLQAEWCDSEMSAIHLCAVELSTIFSRDYHQATDEPQYINYDLTARVARFVHDVAQAAANRPERLAVLPIEEQDPAARCGG